MRRIVLLATLTLALQFTAFVSTSWFFGQSATQNPISTVFGQEVAPVPEAAPAAPDPGTVSIAQIPLPPPGPPPVVGVGAYAGTAFTIDICEGDIYRKVGIGGKVGPDSMIGQDVYVSRGSSNARVATVHPDGTFQGVSPDGFGAVGQTATISIRSRGEAGIFVYSCTVKAGAPGPSTAF